MARSYFQLLRLNEQLGVARRLLAQRTQALRLVQDRVNAGLTRASNCAKAKGPCRMPGCRLKPCKNS